MKFKLKNYTTQISAEKSIFEIEQLLNSFGATKTMKEFTAEGKVKSLAFMIDTKSFKLPANVEGVKNVLFKDKRYSGKRDAMANRNETAYRVAWRVLRDWIYSQLSVVASGQAQPDEMLLPFIYDGKRTLYQAYKEGFLQLENKGDEE